MSCARGRKPEKRATKKVIKGKILGNREISSDYFVMDINAPWLGRNSCPGQFVNVKVQEGVTDPLLRIPLGIHKVRASGISLLYKVVGKGTELLKNRRKGELVDILGPLGKGFDVSPVINKKNAAAILVSGGHGIAPLFFLAERIAKKRRKIEFFAGAGTGEHIVYGKELRKLGAKVRIATEDGSCGAKGCVTDILKKYLKQTTNNKQRAMIYACGPRPMIAAVASLSKKYGISAQVTYDEYMACGIGACRGCAVETIEGIKLACEDGPVFSADILKW